MIGRTLSHYKVLEELSPGGMGIVYRAVDLKLDRKKAPKVLPLELVSNPEPERIFYEYWKDGDMDRERVEEEKSKLGIT